MFNIRQIKLRITQNHQPQNCIDLPDPEIYVHLIAVDVPAFSFFSTT